MSSVRPLPRRGESPASALQRRTADVLVDILAQNGVDTVFGLPGGAIAPIYDALLDRPDIRVVTAKHETSAMFAAAAYARTTGKLGVVLVTSGPGILNAVTGLASAHCDGIPVLLIGGEVSRKVMGRGALQEGSAYHLDMVGIAKRLSKSAIQINEANAAPSMLRRAISTALSGRRGPVMVTLPIDVASAEIREPDVASAVSTSFGLDSKALDRTAQALLRGATPVIFAGAGVRSAGAALVLREVAERLQCPVITTPKGKGVFPEDHPLSLGVFGIGGHPSATDHLKHGVDVMLAIGTSLGELSTNGWSDLIAPSIEFIHVDIDANQIGKCYPVTLSVIASADTFLTALRDRLPKPSKLRTFGIRHHHDPESESDPSSLISPQRALWEIQQVLPSNTIYTVDAGEHYVFATHHLKIRHPDSFIVMTGLGSMGQSIPGAIGAQLACPGRTVAAICGDGCFAMNGTEVATAVSERLPILVFVMNDERLGMVELGLTALYGRTSTYPTTIDFPTVARGLGAQTMVVEHPGQILGTDFDALRRNGPVVVDVRVDKSARMPKHGRFEALGNIVKKRN